MISQQPCNSGLSCHVEATCHLNTRTSPRAANARQRACPTAHHGQDGSGGERQRLTAAQAGTLMAPDPSTVAKEQPQARRIDFSRGCAWGSAGIRRDRGQSAVGRYQAAPQHSPGVKQESAARNGSRGDWRQPAPSFRVEGSANYPRGGAGLRATARRFHGASFVPNIYPGATPEVAGMGVERARSSGISAPVDAVNEEWKTAFRPVFRAISRRCSDGAGQPS